MLKSKPIGAWWTLDQVLAHFRARGEQIDLLTLMRLLLDKHGVRFERLPQWGGASLVVVGPYPDVEGAFRAGVFWSEDILAPFPTPTPATTPVEAITAPVVEATIAAMVVPEVTVELPETAPTAPVVVDAAPRSGLQHIGGGGSA